MKPTSYKSKFEDIDKQQILSTINELRDQTDRISGVLAIADTLIVEALKTSELYTSFAKPYIAARKTTVFKGMSEDLHGIDQRLAMLSTLVKDQFDDNVIAAGLTYDKVGVLQFIEAMSFGLDFIKRFTDDIIVIETALIDKGGPVPDNKILNKGELAWLETGKRRYLFLLDYLKQPVKSIERQLLNIPEVLVDWNENAVVSVVGSRSNPFPSNFSWSPILFVRRVIEERRIDRYQEIDNEIQALEFRILALKNRIANKADPKVERTLEGLSNRLNKYRARLAEIQEAYSEE